ncbi:alpha/beta fold hydrolase [Helicobacter salomonis]|uniref:alpha/beta fold hydrolase n=1 Tax=Helicobacter salomonis TaxID=56878 RepID=UPI000CF017D4|nr:alpha/beta hydrolase [Helicobacter salomonis]
MARRKIVYQGHDFEIAYDLHNKSAPKSVVFLHGWGSSKELMQHAFKTHFTDYQHFYLDLPGFGKSPNQTFLTPQDYAHIIDAFFQSLGIVPDLMVGHSFGGKVATLCHSQDLVLLSSAGIVLPKSFKTRLKIRLAKGLRALGVSNRTLRSADAQGLNPAMYETFKYTIQEDFRAHFSACTKNTLILWGEQDHTTPLKAGQQIATLIPNNRLVIMPGDHYFFLKQGALVQQHCLEYFSAPYMAKQG